MTIEAHKRLTKSLATKRPDSVAATLVIGHVNTAFSDLEAAASGDIPYHEARDKKAFQLAKKATYEAIDAIVEATVLVQSAAS